MRIKPGRETITFNGIQFYRYAKSKNWAERSYFRPRVVDVARGIEALHREIWKARYGPIQNDCDIHHIDGNPLNNDISNLECLTKAEHRKRHKTHKVKPVVGQLARAMAAKWHRSPDGRKWHSNHARLEWQKRKPASHICEMCGLEFKSKSSDPSVKFCSNNCKSAVRRRDRRDMVERYCAYCGKPFQCNKYEPTHYCGNSCAKRASDERRRYASWRKHHTP